MLYMEACMLDESLLQRWLAVGRVESHYAGFHVNPRCCWSRFADREMRCLFFRKRGREWPSPTARAPQVTDVRSVLPHRRRSNCFTQRRNSSAVQHNAVIRLQKGACWEIGLRMSLESLTWMPETRILACLFWLVNAVDDTKS
jgi:hypothetical protein